MLVAFESAFFLLFFYRGGALDSALLAGKMSKTKYQMRLYYWSLLVTWGNGRFSLALVIRCGHLFQPGRGHFGKPVGREAWQNRTESSAVRTNSAKNAKRYAASKLNAFRNLPQTSEPTINPRQMKRRLSARPPAKRWLPARPLAARLIRVKAAGSSERGLTRRLSLLTIADDFRSERRR